MRHPHVRVYTNDHADAADLVHDYPCRDLGEAERLMLELVQAYTDRVGAQGDMGDVVEFEEAAAVTLRPQGQALSPVHLSIHFCEERHAADGTLVQ